MATTTITTPEEIVGENSPSAAKKFRVQIDFDASEFALINQLVEELRFSTRSELFRSSLRALRWMVRKKAEGSTVLAITQDNRFLEPEFDFLSDINPPAHEIAPRKPALDLEGERKSPLYAKAARDAAAHG